MNSTQSVSIGMGYRRAAGTLFFLTGAVFVTFTMLAAAMAPGYDFGNAAISDLGTFGETAALFNTTLVLVGLLNIGAGVCLIRAGARHHLLVLAIVAGVGAAGAGVFPLGRFEIHGLFALLAFIFFNVQSIALSTRLHGPSRIIGMAAGAMGLVFVVLMVAGDSGATAAFGAIGHGGTERMIAYPPMLWLMGLGGVLMNGR